MEDTELMMQFKAGDKAAFRKIVEMHYQNIYGLCYRYLNNREDAEEVAQDVFIKLYQSASSYKPSARLTTYLYKIAVTRSLNRIRDRKRRRSVSIENAGRYDESLLMAENFNPHEILEREEKHLAVRKAIDSLPEHQRTAVILKRYQELSYEEIAEVMKCSVSAVEARLHRARASLEKKLKGWVVT